MEFITNMRVSDLLPYREFDRVEKPAPRIPYLQQYTVQDVIDWLSKGNNMPPLELSIVDDKALLTDGNHRLAAASLLNIEVVPVKVKYFGSMEDVANIFYSNTLQRFKRVN